MQTHAQWLGELAEGGERAQLKGICANDLELAGKALEGPGSVIEPWIAQDDRGSDLSAAAPLGRAQDLLPARRLDVAQIGQPDEMDATGGVDSAMDHEYRHAERLVDPHGPGRRRPEIDDAHRAMMRSSLVQTCDSSSAAASEMRHGAGRSGPKSNAGRTDPSWHGWTTQSGGSTTTDSRSRIHSTPRGLCSLMSVARPRTAGSARDAARSRRSPGWRSNSPYR